MREPKYKFRELEILLLILLLCLIAPATGVYTLIRVQQLSQSIERTSQHVGALSQTVTRLAVRHSEFSFWLNQLPYSEQHQQPTDNPDDPGALKLHLEARAEAQLQDLEKMATIFALLEDDSDQEIHHDTLALAVQASTALKQRFGQYLNIMKKVVRARSSVARLDILSGSQELASEIERSIAAIGGLVDALTEQSKEAIDREEDREIIEILIMIAASLIIGLTLALQIRSLQHRIVNSEKLALLGATAVALNHEINNPLAVISGTAYLLQQTELTKEERAVHLETIAKMTEQIAQVVNKIGALEEVSTTDYLRGEKMLDLSK